MSEDIIDTKKLERLKARVSTIGNLIGIVGWLSVLVMTPIYVYLGYKDNIFTGFVGITDIVLSILLSSVFIILGARIRDGVDMNIKKYVQVLITILICILILYWLAESLGGVIMWLGIGLLVFLICSWFIVGNIVKKKEFAKTLSKPVYKYFDKKGWIIFVLSSVILMTGAVFIDLTLDDEMYWDSLSEEEYSEETDNKLAAMVAILNDRPFPSKLSDNITLLGIKEQQSGSIQYTYEIQNIDSSQLSTEFLKDLMVQEYCSSEFFNYILDQEIDIAHSFTTEKGENYFVTLDFSSCKSSSSNLLYKSI
jgi:hypothetical protein